jgi:hypothetical protein
LARGRVVAGRRGKGKGRFVRVDERAMEVSEEEDGR